ncbi:uncharacterized protein PV09_09522 [Verruconis gallopava]|uniref:BRCT domain-containing protein n=1 Tax=Verruconis gallopava TaxID=253628 RepID=A0A0D1ZXA9_9PEZI|nr:uncharacterized protein PV09_09522 [Verruconis gallopava]KIV98694.1 hypothetical protein PV09_09522 [Verruconis gallopava]
MAHVARAMDVDETNPFDSLPLFHDVFFTIVPSPDFSEDARLKAERSLKDNGAQLIPFNASTNTVEPLNEITHIIAATSDFPQYDDALDRYIHVVKPSWIKHSLDKGKQSNPRQFSPDPKLIMSDVVMCCADIPEGDKEAIAGGCLAMGGLFSENLSKLTTHLIALSIDDERCQRAVLKNLSCKIVLPHWFDDCLRLGKRISETPYLLPNPEVLRKQEKPPAQRISRDVVGAASPHPINQLPSPSPSSDGPRQLDVFHKKSVMLSSDLGLGPELQKTLSDLISSGGGAVANKIEMADTYVCRYREGDDYVYASQHGMDVGNLAWLYFLITTNRWTSPLRRLLHYPVPRNGVPGFEKYIISVSNYSGEARAYLENLVKACGAEFTKTMHQNNTHLITAHEKSEKCEAAKDWNINVINHLWIEESYARYQVQSLSVKRYTHFPERINLGEVIGQTQLDRTVLEKNFYPRPKQTRKRAQESDDEVEQRVNNQNRTSARKSKRGDNDAQSTPVLPKFIDPGKENMTPCSRGANGPAKSNLHELAADVAPYDKKKKRKDGVRNSHERRSSMDEITTPYKQGSINGTTPASRGAKDKAMSRIHENAADIAQYEREKKRKGGVIHGKERRSLDTEELAPRGKKRQSTELEDEAATSDGGESCTIARVGKRAKSEQVTYKLVLTSYTRWQENPKAEASERNILRNLGIHLTDDTSKADILCAPKILRTPKFVCSIANAPYVVSSSFLDYCIKNKKVPDPEQYLLQDRETEDRLGFRLADALERAEANKHKLLDTWQIFCTEQVRGGFETFKQIIEANGGACLRYQGRTQMQVRKRKDVESQEETKETLYMLSGESPVERALWPKFRLMAEKADMIPVICKPDWLLNLAMSQEILWDDKWELGDEGT